MKYLYPSHSSNGFTLPVILLIGLSLMIIGLSVMQTNSSIRMSFEDQYYNRIANEAAEAGIVRANYCLDQNNFVQKWGSNKDTSTKPPLKQSTDCSGTTLSPALSSVISGPSVRSTFSIPDLEVRDDGAIVIVSQGTSEVLSINGTSIRTYNVTLKQLVNWKKYEASTSYSGASRTCGIVTGEVYCWGNNPKGQLGDGTTNTSYIPVKVVQEPGLLAGKKVDDMFTAYWHNCALAVGKVYCWGFGADAEMGNNGFTDTNPKPLLVEGALSGKTVTDVGGTFYTSCAIAEGKIYCWGRGNSARDGKFDSTGTNVSGTSATKVPTLVTTTNLDATYGAGNYHAIALSTSGSNSQTMCAIINGGESETEGDAWCWGNNDAGQIGNGNTTGVRIPTKVKNNAPGDALYGKKVIAITQDGDTGSYGPSPVSGHFSHVCVVANDNKAYCWGENSNGELGVNDNTDRYVPTEVDPTGLLNGKTVTGINAGIYHTCALASGNIYCWGRGTFGQLGTGNTNPSKVPVLVDQTILGGKTVTSVGGGTNRGCAVADLKSYCWGANNSGQIGDGTRNDRFIPTESIYLRPKAPAFIF